jgi:hypothetical protein
METPKEYAKVIVEKYLFNDNLDLSTDEANYVAKIDISNTIRVLLNMFKQNKNYIFLKEKIDFYVEALKYLEDI